MSFFKTKFNISNLIFCVIVIPLFILILGCDNSSENRKYNKKKQLLIDYGKVVKTLKEISSNLRRYYEIYGKYPNGTTLEQLQPELQRIKFYIDTPLKDPWGNPYYFLHKEEYKKDFYLYSAGSDGKFEGFNQHGRYDVTELKNGKDVIYYNYLIYWPNVDQLNQKQIKLFFQKNKKINY